MIRQITIRCFCREMGDSALFFIFLEIGIQRYGCRGLRLSLAFGSRFVGFYIGNSFVVFISPINSASVLNH